MYPYIGHPRLAAPCSVGRNAVYSRYSTSDWDTSNQANYHTSERERSLAERLRASAWQTVKATDQRTRNRQASNTKRLGGCTGWGGAEGGAEGVGEGWG